MFSSTVGLRLCIAEQAFALSADFPWAIEETDEAYADFVSLPAGAPGADAIAFSLHASAAPLCADCQPLFDTAESWALESSSDSYLLRYAAPHLNEPLAVVSLRKDFSSGEIYCGPGLIMEQGGRTVVSSPVHYPVDQVLLMCVFARKRGLIVHAAGLDLDGKGLMFAGRSGAGKTTLSRILQERNGFSALSDDRVVMRQREQGYSVHGTPWPGDARIARNASAPLRALLFLEQAQDNHIREVPPRDAMKRIAAVASIPWFDRMLLEEQLAFCDRLLADVPAYVFSFTPDERAADAIERFF